MGKSHTWTDQDLLAAVQVSKSYRAVIMKLGLVPAGGNYMQIQARIRTLQIPVNHFTGKRWNSGMNWHTKTRPPLTELLVPNSKVQSYKLKQRLYEEGIKRPQCEFCGWAEMSTDGRIPVELDHINGDHYDNRLENLRILCPNCHSLQLTHRGKNIHKERVRVHMLDP